MLQMVLSVLRNYRAEAASPGLGLWDLIKVVDGHNGRRLGIADKNRYEWRVLLVAGMWFQDLFNYDFRRTEMCIIPYGTQVGEVSFCAYNTGVGWRQIVEEMFQVSSTKDWYAKKGRHEIFAHGKAVPLPIIGEDGRLKAPLRVPQFATGKVAAVPAGAGANGSAANATGLTPAGGGGNGNGHAPIPDLLQIGDPARAGRSSGATVAPVRLNRT
jgi:hypothetical protein